MTLRSAFPMTPLASLSTAAANSVRTPTAYALALLALFSVAAPADSASAGCETVIENPENGSSEERFGHAVALDGDLAVFGASTQTIGGIQTGAAFVFERDGTTWSHVATLAASDGATLDRFGHSVAVDGDVIAVGAYHKDVGGIQDAGAAYVFRWNGSSWIEEAIVTAPTPTTNARLGSSVAIRGDAVAAGAPACCGQTPGSVVVFGYDGATWAFNALLRPSDANSDSTFGTEMAMDANEIIIGDPRSGPESGAAYIFAHEQGTWIEKAKLTVAGLGLGSNFGAAVALQGDLAVVSAHHFQLDPFGRVGAAFVFRRDASEWLLERTLFPVDLEDERSFGSSLALDGTTLLVGDIGADNPAGAHDGTVYVFDLASADNSDVTQLFPNQPSCFFGRDAAIYGEWALVGTGCNDGPAYLYPIRRQSADCNANGINDACDLDCDFNGTPDTCDGFGDCNGNALIDSCDIAIQHSVDCDGNWVPDECDLTDGNAQDCNTNSIPDTCDVATGLSRDCNANTLPDECDIADGASTDCNGNRVPDECDADCNGNMVPDGCDVVAGTSADCNADVIPDECQPDQDCNANGVTDICDIGSWDAIDCNLNLSPDVCDIADGVSFDDDGNGIPDECDRRPLPDAAFDIDGTVRTCNTDADCLVGLHPDSEVYCIPVPLELAALGTCYVQRNKYISIDPNLTTPSTQTARRISLVLDDGGTAILGWVGQPTASSANGETTPQWLSRIDGLPYYENWGDLDTIHVGDCEIVPGHAFRVQAIANGADISDDANYSAPLELRTVANYGDVVGSSVGHAPDGVRNFKDINAVVRGFQSLQTVSKVWLDLYGNFQAPFVPDFSNVSHVDISAVVNGFQGGWYPWFAPLDCPDQINP